MITNTTHHHPQQQQQPVYATALVSAAVLPYPAVYEIAFGRQSTSTHQLFPAAPVLFPTAAAPASSVVIPTTPSAQHHLAHLASTVLASLHQLDDFPRRALRRRLHRLLSAAALNPNCVMLGLYYLRRASQLATSDDSNAKLDVAYTAASPDTQFLAAVVLAQKWCEDAAYTCRTWAELAVDALYPDMSVSMVLAHLNAAERALLARLGWELRVDQVEFANWCDRLRRWASNLLPTTTASSFATATSKPEPAASLLQPSYLVVGSTPMLTASSTTQHGHTMQSMMPRPWSPAYGRYSNTDTACSLTSFASSFFSSTHGFWAVPGA